MKIVVSWKEVKAFTKLNNKYLDEVRQQVAKIDEDRVEWINDNLELPKRYSQQFRGGVSIEIRRIRGIEITIDPRMVIAFMDVYGEFLSVTCEAAITSFFAYMKFVEVAAPAFDDMVDKMEDILKV